MNKKRATEIDTLVAQRVRAQRLRLGITQIQLSEKLGVTFQQVQKYEKGINRVGAGRLFELARALYIPIEALFPTQEMDILDDGSSKKQKELSEFVLTAETLRLCRAFLRVKDAEVRKSILEFVENSISK